MCVCVCLYVEPFSRYEDYVRSRIKIGFVVCLYTPLSPSVPEMEGVYATGGILSWGCTLVEFIYLIFTRMPGGVTVGDLGLCCCVPCPSSAIISLRFTEITFIWTLESDSNHRAVQYSTQYYMVGRSKASEGRGGAPTSSQRPLWSQYVFCITMTGVIYASSEVLITSFLFTSWRWIVTSPLSSLAP